MAVSVIIPTYNRVKELEETLDSIIVQTTIPKEIIIVDDSDNDEIENLIEHRKNEFKEKSMLLKYIRNEKEKSLTIARNVGIENAAGDVISFLDDDVVLDREYIREILKVYDAYPDALGVQGYIADVVFSTFWNRIDKILFRGGFEKVKCRILPSGCSTYPYLLDKIITCQWLSGANQHYKRKVMHEFRFDENLKRYSYMEDADLSYRVYKQYPNTLYITPHARLIHKASEEGKLPNNMAIQMKYIYSLYFFYKHIDQNVMNRIIVIWCWLGYAIMKTAIAILSFVIRGSKSGLVTAKYTIGAYIICMRHLKEIKKGDLKFFNKRLS